MYLRETSEPLTLNTWQTYIGKQYEVVNQYLTPQAALEEMIKDVGKLSKTIRKRELDEIDSALASIFIWSLTLANEMREDFESLVSAKYQNVCSGCGATKCECTSKPENIRVIFASFGHHAVEKERDVIKNVTEGQNRRLILDSRSPLGITVDSLIHSHNALALCDAAVVLLNGVDWSIEADLMEILATIDRQVIWLYSRKEPPDEETRRFIAGLQNYKGYPSIKFYDDFDQLRYMYEQDLTGSRR